MSRDEVAQKIKEHESELRSMGVLSLLLFGSMARDEARPDSDIDMLVELQRPAGLFKLIEVQQRLEEILGRSVDLGTPGGLKSGIKERVLAEALRVA